MNSTINSGHRILRIKELIIRLQLARSTIYELQATNQFPKSFKITLGGRAAGWVESEIEAWIESRSKGGAQ